MSGAVTPASEWSRPGSGRLLPEWLDTRDPQAQAGTVRVRAVDPELLVGWDRRRHVYQVWGPSLSMGGWVPICVCMDDHGRPFRGAFIPWELVVAALVQARDGKLSADIAHEHNERLRQAEEQRQDERTQDAARYYARAISGEAAGWGRWSAEDVSRGYRQRWI